MADAAITEPLLDWFDVHARDLPWRARDTTPWGVLVSEVMLQQTPVARVIEPYAAWLARWPEPAALARESPGEAIRMWRNLGYPRRALRLHGCATAVVDHHDGHVPADLDSLLKLPGIGDYTARAVLAFGHGGRAPVVDVNVRRAVARLTEGRPDGGAATTRRDLVATDRLLPPDPATACRVSAALMELGALVCTARTPACGTCPVSGHCEWLRNGAPVAQEAARRRQPYQGTDRQVRGLLLKAVREAAAGVPETDLDLLWHEDAQRKRSLAGLVADGLVARDEAGVYRLPL